jgi:5-methylcytosine-specific restriction endonuclease McrA
MRTERDRERWRAWAEANREARREYQRQWREKNREYVHAYMRGWHASNAAREQQYRISTREQSNARARKRWQRNAELERARTRAKSLKRRARLADACSAGVPVAFWQLVAECFGGVCAYCYSRPGATIDHVVPIARGGRDEPGNVVPCCMRCNCSKGRRLLCEWETGAPEWVRRLR